MEATLPHLPETLKALVLVLWHTGLRVGEVEGLTTGMIDRSGNVWRSKLEAHENAHRGRGRTILLGPEAIEAIRPWLRPDEPDEPIFSPLRVDARQAIREGERLTGRTYSRTSPAQALRRAIARTGGKVGPWSLAQLRHPRATAMREKHGLDVAAGDRSAIPHPARPRRRRGDPSAGPGLHGKLSGDRVSPAGTLSAAG